MKNNIFNKAEQKIITSLKTPWQVQEFVDSLEYNAGKRIPVIDVMRLKKGDCLEVAMFSCFVLQEHKIKSFLIDLSAVKDEDHVLCVFKIKGLYGAIAQSKFLGLRYRHPVYKSLRELAISYFDNYFSFKGYFGLRSHSAPLVIKFNSKNLSSVVFVKETEERFSEIVHDLLVPKNIELSLASKEKFKREIIILPDYIKVPKRYK